MLEKYGDLLSLKLCGNYSGFGNASYLVWGEGRQMNIFSHFSSSSDGGWELRDRCERKTLHFTLKSPYAHLRALYVPAKNQN